MRGGLKPPDESFRVPTFNSVTLFCETNPIVIESCILSTSHLKINIGILLPIINTIVDNFIFFYLIFLFFFLQPQSGSGTFFSKTIFYFFLIKFLKKLKVFFLFSLNNILVIIIQLKKEKRLVDCTKFIKL